ncbi:GGDEF domain-containing protein [Pseudomonas viridiflava]|uniref:GGDEF domain-containing protein n=1 Tax=Pseudomonas viridiflava TaxID=33069 RepID=UPI002A6B35D7|nr:GGDEF domain-containing protein [Pseudomonas viridiflava]MDY0935721.1 GGDEF domain-containing protein [Pseudomonas viridiflava]MDY1012312.1 GGDEF domain-containing protein [Pseudomonas viridiflava]
MHRDLKLRPRIKQLLAPAVLQAELVGVASWLWVLAVDPLLELNVFTSLLTAGLACVCYAHHYAASFGVWRFLGILYVFLLTMGFLYVINVNPTLAIFSLPLAITLVMSGALLFVSFQDYLVSAAFVWLLTWLNWHPGYSGDLGTYVVIFCVASVCIGGALNLSYLRNLKAVLSLESKFRELAQTDYLTSIPNRRAFMETFAEMIAEGSQGYFIMLDIDSFKLMNDQHGHDVGDQILCSMAACLKATKGSYCVGRIGGEEFGVLVAGHEQSNATHYVLSLLSTIRGSLESPYCYTCSAGMARISTGSTMTDALKVADKNMYLAKRNGKGCAYFEGKPLHSLPPADSRLESLY